MLLRRTTLFVRVRKQQEEEERCMNIVLVLSKIDQSWFNSHCDPDTMENPLWEELEQLIDEHAVSSILNIMDDSNNPVVIEGDSLKLRCTTEHAKYRQYVDGAPLIQRSPFSSESQLLVDIMDLMADLVATEWHRLVDAGDVVGVRARLSDPVARKEINVADNTFGWTPLHLAVITRSEAIVELLAYSQEVDLNKKTGTGGKTALELAKGKGMKSIAEILVAADGARSGGEFEQRHKGTRSLKEKIRTVERGAILLTAASVSVLIAFLFKARWLG